MFSVCVQLFGDLALVIQTGEEFKPPMPKVEDLASTAADLGLTQTQVKELHFESVKSTMKVVESLKRHHRAFFSTLMDPWACSVESRILIQGHPDYQAALLAGDPNKLFKIILATP